MTNITNAIISGLLFGAAHGMIVPAHSYPNITEPETIHCKQITETILECDRYQMSGVFIESYYLDMYTNEHTLQDPREPEIVEPVVVEEPDYIAEPDTQYEPQDIIKPDTEYNQPTTTSDPLLNDKF